jgi:hypothetical protein
MTLHYGRATVAWPRGVDRTPRRRQGQRSLVNPQNLGFLRANRIRVNGMGEIAPHIDVGRTAFESLRYTFTTTHRSHRSLQAMSRTTRRKYI